MRKYTSFEHFARDLFLLSRSFKMSQREAEKYDPIPLMDDAWYILDIFADGHCEHFRREFVDIEEAVLQTDEHFFKLAIPRCLKIIDLNRYFYSLMLVASFLQELVTFLRDTRVCYRFHFTAYKCFVAVFERAFVNSFESNGGWEGLEEFLSNVIRTHDSTNESLIVCALNSGNPSLTLEVLDLIAECNDISDDFDLNEYEYSLLMDADITGTNLDQWKKSLDYEDDEDPLNLTWPPDDEEICKKLDFSTLRTQKEVKVFRSPSKYLKTEKDMDDSEGFKYFEVSILEEYIPKIEAEAELLLGTERFREKMRLRTCPCCRIKCYLFSYELFTKQIDLALTNSDESP